MLYCVKSRSPDIKRRAAWKFNRRGGTCMGSTYMYISMYDAVMLDSSLPHTCTLPLILSSVLLLLIEH